MSEWADERTAAHGIAGEAVYVPGVGWARACTCGKVFRSQQSWQHVPPFYDHLSAPNSTLGVWGDAAEKIRAALGGSRG